MCVSGLLSAALLPCCWLLAALAAAATDTDASVAPRAAATSPVPAGNLTDEARRKMNSIFSGMNVDGLMIQRALYALVGITAVAVLYFLIRAVRLKKPVPRKKYGLLSNYDDQLEMAGESEEDDTLYEARSLHR